VDLFKGPIKNYAQTGKLMSHEFVKLVEQPKLEDLDAMAKPAHGMHPLGDLEPVGDLPSMLEDVERSSTCSHSLQDSPTPIRLTAGSAGHDAEEAHAAIQIVELPDVERSDRGEAETKPDPVDGGGEDAVDMTPLNADAKAEGFADIVERQDGPHQITDIRPDHLDGKDGSAHAAKKPRRDLFGRKAGHSGSFLEMEKSSRALSLTELAFKKRKDAVKKTAPQEPEPDADMGKEEAPPSKEHGDCSSPSPRPLEVHSESMHNQDGSAEVVETALAKAKENADVQLEVLDCEDGCAEAAVDSKACSAGVHIGKADDSAEVETAPHADMHAFAGC